MTRCCYGQHRSHGAHSLPICRVRIAGIKNQPCRFFPVQLPHFSPKWSVHGRVPVANVPNTAGGTGQMVTTRLTRHARQRLQQRGSRQKEIAIVMAYGDIEVPARDGARYLRLSRRQVAWLLEREIFPLRDLDHAKRLLVLADAFDRVVTIMKCDPERSPRVFARARRR
jgi:hypothetical protein